MKLNLVKLKTELSSCAQSENILKDNDMSRDSVIFNELYLPLSKGEDVPFSQIPFEKFDYSDICGFIHTLYKNSEALRMQENWLDGINNFKPVAKQTKEYF